MCEVCVRACVCCVCVRCACAHADLGVAAVVVAPLDELDVVVVEAEGSGDGAVEAEDVAENGEERRERPATQREGRVWGEVCMCGREVCVCGREVGVGERCVCVGERCACGREVCVWERGVCVWERCVCGRGVCVGEVCVCVGEVCVWERCACEPVFAALLLTDSGSTSPPPCTHTCTSHPQLPPHTSPHSHLPLSGTHTSLPHTHAPDGLCTLRPREYPRIDLSASLHAYLPHTPLSTRTHTSPDARTHAPDGLCALPPGERLRIDESVLDAERHGAHALSVDHQRPAIINQSIKQ